MSYDISLTSACGGFYHEIGDVTWNVCPLFYWAFDTEEGIRGLNDMDALSAATIVGGALERIAKAEPGSLDKFEPPNGWGSVAGATELLVDIRAACLEHPTATVNVT